MQPQLNKAVSRAAAATDPSTDKNPKDYIVFDGAQLEAQIDQNAVEENLVDIFHVDSVIVLFSFRGPPGTDGCSRGAPKRCFGESPGLLLL